MIIRVLSVLTILSAVALTSSGTAGAADAVADSVSASSGAASLSLGVADSPSGEKEVGVRASPQDGSASKEGTASVIGFPVILEGNWAVAEWNVTGVTVSGKLVNTSGDAEGTFQGTLTPTGLSGTYTTSDGRTGLWSWNGPMPAAQP